MEKIHRQEMQYNHTTELKSLTIVFSENSGKQTVVRKTEEMCEMYGHSTLFSIQ